MSLDVAARLGPFIPVRAKHWLFFREHVLVHHKEEFFTMSLDKAGFVTKFKSIFSPSFFQVSAPFYLRGKSSKHRLYRRRLTEACWPWYEALCLAEVEVRPSRALGLAVFTLKTRSLEVDQAFPYLTGEVVPLKPPELQILEANDFPLLYGRGIMIGPLALLNHTNSADKLLLSGEKRVVARAKSEGVWFRKGAQVTVNYIEGTRRFASLEEQRRCAEALADLNEA